MKKRTELRSSAGKKLYAVRDAGGKFEDIQSFELAHGSDVKRSSKAETAAKGKKATKKSATRSAAAPKTTKKAAKKSTKKAAKKTSRR